MKKKRFLLPLGGIALYLLLLRLLSLAERGVEGTQISTFFDALWYSLVTMTTVGYGDVVPQTWLGKAIGCVFLFVSLGVLTSLLSLAYSLMVGQMLPRLRLWWRRNRPWHIFPQANAQSIAMAKALKQEDPGNVTIFLEEGSGDAGDITLRLSAQQLLEAAKGSAAFYYLGDTTPEICREAALLAQSHSPVYCSTRYPKCFGPNAFLPEEAVARLYWKQHPLQRQEQTIVFLGGRRWLPRLLEQALLVNLYSLDQQLQYHIYGDEGSFLATHYRLTEFCAVNAFCPGRDSLWFHQDFPAPELLQKADRLILCQDTQEENLMLLHTLREFFPMTAKLYVQLEHDIFGDTQAIPYGTVEALYTPENVIHQALDTTAIRIYEPYRRLDPERNPDWEELSLESKADNYAPADHVLTKLQILLEDRSITEITPETCAKAMEIYRRELPQRQDFFRELEHLRWCRWRYLRNWTYSPEKDASRRLHHLLRDFRELPEEEKRKDDNPWEAIGTLFSQ